MMRSQDTLKKSNVKTKDSADAVSKTLSKLAAQKAQALANNDTKTAALIQRIITLLEKK